MDEVGRHRLRRELDQRRSVGRLRRDGGQHPGGGRRLSRALPGRADLPEGTDQGGLDRDERGHHRPDLRPRPGLLREKAEEVERRSSARSPASPRTTSSSRRTSPGRGRGRSRGRPALRAQARRRPPGGRLVDGRRGGRRHLPGGKAYDVQVWSTPETRDSLTDIENLLLDTPERRARAAEGRRRRVDRRRRPTSSTTRACPGTSTSAPTSTDRDLGSVVADSRTVSRRTSCPSSTTPSCSASSRSGRRRSDA